MGLCCYPLSTYHHWRPIYRRMQNDHYLWLSASITNMGFCNILLMSHTCVCWAGAETALGLGGSSPPRPQKTMEPPLSPLLIFWEERMRKKERKKKGRERKKKSAPLQPFLDPPLPKINTYQPWQRKRLSAVEWIRSPRLLRSGDSSLHTVATEYSMES